MDLFTEKVKYKVNQKKIITHLKANQIIAVSCEELKSTFVEDDQMAVLLDLLLQEYTTFRVFADANKVMERHKLKKKPHYRKRKACAKI